MPIDTKSIRPRDLLVDAGKLYPQAWILVDKFRAQRGQGGLPDWPSWCFLPLSAFYAIVSADAGVEQLPPQLVTDVARLGALGTWRVSQGIYRFDPTVYLAIRDTPLKGDLPSEIFYRLPEWCVYIETPDVMTPWGRQYGAFVHLEWDANTGRTELRLVLDTDDELLPMILHLGDWSVSEALERMGAEAAYQAHLAGYERVTPNRSVLVDMHTSVDPIVSLTLYLCSQNAEYARDKPQHPKPKKTKKGWRMFPPDKPKTWEVAVRLGFAIRRYYQAEQTTTAGTRAGPRPHIRRAHWHSYWTGPRDDTRSRKLIVKWMPPIPVNVDDNDLPSTIKPVE